jgi:molybdopterin synthase catalytic subunit
MSVSVQEADFDVGAETAALSAGRRRGRGGQLRRPGPGRQAERGGSAVSAMTLEHYPGMTEKSLEAIVAEAAGAGACWACG